MTDATTNSVADAAARTRQILVVDDAALMRLFCRQAFERAGFQVREAINGIEALEILLGTPCDLIVLDVNMPRMDGLSFLRQLRRQEQAIAGIPVLVVSTEAGQADREAARDAGANWYLVKPVTQEVLLHHAGLLVGATG